MVFTLRVILIETRGSGSTRVREVGRLRSKRVTSVDVPTIILIRYVHETSDKPAAAEIATNKHYLGLGDMKHGVNPTSHHVNEPQYVMISPIPTDGRVSS